MLADFTAQIIKIAVSVLHWVVAVHGEDVIFSR